MDDYLMDRHTCLTPADSKVFVLNKPSVPFDLEARCPTWLAFLEGIWPGDEGQKRELQKMFGLLMTPVTKYQKLFWLLGATGGGKGTIMDVIKGLLEHQASSMPITAFADNFGKQQLVGKTVCLVDEANDTQAVPMASIDFIKSVAGEGQTQIDRKFLEPFVGQLQCRFVFASNHFPAIADSSGAFGRRIHLFSFYKSFKDKPDDTLRGRLLAELAGIAQWALAGLWLLMVEDGGFRTTEAAKAKWEILQFRLAKVGAAISSFLVADPEGRLPVSAFRELLSRYYRATGWERAAEPDPRLAEEVMTHFATAGSTLTAEQDDHGKLHLIGVSWSPSGRKSLQEYGLDPSGVALDNDTKVK
jgi:P4 family phage/plasmid primase-like protien